MKTAIMAAILLTSPFAFASETTEEKMLSDVRINREISDICDNINNAWFKLKFTIDAAANPKLEISKIIDELKEEKKKISIECPKKLPKDYPESSINLRIAIEEIESVKKSAERIKIILEMVGKEKTYLERTNKDFKYLATDFLANLKKYQSENLFKETKEKLEQTKMLAQNPPTIQEK